MASVPYILNYTCEPLIPGHPRGVSGIYERQLLYKFSLEYSLKNSLTNIPPNIPSKLTDLYLMDNHGLALWSIKNLLNSQHKKNQYHLFHLDAHEDYSPSLLNYFEEQVKKQKQKQKQEQEQVKKQEQVQVQFQELGLEVKNYLSYIPSDLQVFLKEEDPRYHCPLYRWDNYLPVLFSSLAKKVAATYELGNKAPWDQRLWGFDLLKNFPQLFMDDKQWIINIDADFFYPLSHKKNTLYDHGWITEFFEQIKSHVLSQDVAQIIFALSPECCGGWEQSLVVWNLFAKVFGLENFKFQEHHLK